MSKENHSRYYYMSNQNMSDIKQSIDEYSMNFQRQSGVHGNSKSKSQIQQMISGSHQITQSRHIGKSKTYIHPKQTIEEQKNINQPVEQINTNQPKKAVYLGQQVLKTIKQRYYQTNKLSTEDPEVLYNFYLSQRKQLSSMKQIKNQDIQKQMPSMQRKLLVKRQFQKILTYYPDDVYYTLCCEVQKIRKDRQLQQKVQYLNQGAQNNKNKKKSQRQISEIVQKLYNTKGNFGVKQKQLSRQQKQKIKLVKFGRNLSQYYQNSYRQRGSPANIQTVQKLYNFWEQSYQRQQYGIQWDQDHAKVAIQQYMYGQIQDLLAYANRKLGFKCAKATSLYKTYQQNIGKIQNIHIPMNSFEEYVKVYNAVQRRKVEHQMARTKSQQQKQKQQKKKNEAKKFGRPVSATPISILAKPKTSMNQIQQLATKYPKDKLIKTLLTEQQLRKPRYGFQYGIYDIQKQVKVKQWVRIDPTKPGEKYEDTITNKLINTFTDPSFFNVQDKDQLMSLLAEQNLEKDATWKQLGPILQQAMLVKAYENDWFRDCILRYLQRITGENNKLETNQVVFKKLFNHLNNLDENQKMAEFQKLQTLILTSQSIAEKTKKIQNLAQNSDNKNKQVKDRRLLYSMLQEKAIDYVKMRIRKTNQKFILRDYLKQLYTQCMKEHKDFIKKNFNVVEGDKQCPKLLKYQFFRIVKQINPITLQRERVLKNHAWIPTKQMPQNFNYKSYNAYSDFYAKDKNIIVTEPEKDKRKTSLWGRKKGKDRQNLMMTYDDANQCTFQPKISKKIT